MSILLKGIDPGKQGAIASLDGVRLSFEPMPLRDGEWCQYLMDEMVEGWTQEGVQRIIVEECHAFPNISAHANAEVMRAYGMWQGVLAAHFFSDQVLYVPAATWKKEMGLVVPIVKAGKVATPEEKKIAYAARKQKSLEVAREKFKHPFKTVRGRDLDGEAEAALLALYGRVAWPRKTP